MTLATQKKLANHIFRLLKVNEIVFAIGRTNKGNLGLKFSANTDDFEIYLDAVPLSVKNMLEDENNIELKKVLEKYLFEDQKQYISVPQGNVIEWTVTGTHSAQPKKAGRPKGSKNKKTNK